MDKNNINQENKEVILDNGVLFAPQKNNYCMFSKSPCGQYGIDDNLKLFFKKNYKVLYFN
jgi:hypothetical protein